MLTPIVFSLYLLAPILNDLCDKESSGEMFLSEHYGLVYVNGKCLFKSAANFTDSLFLGPKFAESFDVETICNPICHLPCLQFQHLSQKKMKTADFVRSWTDTGGLIS